MLLLFFYLSQLFAITNLYITDSRYTVQLPLPLYHWEANHEFTVAAQTGKV